MASERQLPAALRQHMNQDEEIVAISSWTATTDQTTLDGTLPKAAPYDKQRGQFVDTLKNAQLQRLIEEHRSWNSNKGSKFWDSFDPKTCTWRQVWDAAEEAEAEYDTKASGNHIRRVFRSEALVRNAAPLLEGIPENDGLGLLKGGLIILFNAMKRRVQSRDKILKGLRNVPGIIADAQQKQKRFSRDTVLYTRTRELCSALFDAVPLLIGILNRSSGEPLYKTLGRSILGDEVVQVEDILRPVVAAQRAVEQHVIRLENQRRDGDSRSIRATGVEIGVIRQNQTHQHIDTTTRLQSMSQASERIETKIDQVQTDVARMTAKCAEALKESRDRPVNVQILNAVYIIHADSHRMRELCPDQRWVTLSDTPSLAAELAPKFGELHMDQPPEACHERSPDPGHILAALGSDKEIESHVQDLYSTLRKHHEFSDEALAQPAYLASTNRFRRWLGERNPDMLLVDGHAGSGGNERRTPMSVFCATLIQSLLDLDAEPSIQATPRVVLYFFCGQHKDAYGHLPGPSGLMRSLIVQMILAWPGGSRGGLQSIAQLLGTGESPGSGPGKLEVHTLCQILEELLWHLPPGTFVHCIIDGISHFETSIGGWSTDMRTIISSLQKYTTKTHGDSSNPVNFKVLLASASKSIVIRDLIPRDGQVSLRAGNFLSQPLSPRSLSRALSRQALYEEEAQISTQPDNASP